MPGCYGSAWAAASRAFLLEHPTCATCGKPATETDHITPHHGDAALFWDRSNWQPLCHSCHSRKTRSQNEQPDIDRAWLAGRSKLQRPSSSKRPRYNADGTPTSPYHHWNQETGKRPRYPLRAKRKK